jgi:hypothetical protein
MTTDKDDYKKALESVKRLSIKQRQQLIEELARESEISVSALALTGTWVGVSLSAEEIDEARHECWTGLGEEV